MEINIEWLNACNNFRSAIKRSQELLEEMEKPYLTDLGLVPEIHAMLSEYLSTQEPYVAIRAEVLILVYLYEPARLARQQKGRGKKSKILTEIANGIGMSNSSIYVYKTSVMHHYRIYNDFREVVDEGIRMVKNKYPAQSEI